MYLCTCIIIVLSLIIPPSVVSLWKEDLARTNAKAAQSLADPTEYENLFPELREALQAEAALKQERASLKPAALFPSVPVRPLCVACMWCSYNMMYTLRIEKQFSNSFPLKYGFSEK